MRTPVKTETRRSKFDILRPFRPRFTIFVHKDAHNRFHYEVTHPLKQHAALVSTGSFRSYERAIEDAEEVLDCSF